MAKSREEEQQQQGYSGGYEDERMPKSDAIRFLGEVAKEHDVRMARTRLSRLQSITLTMQETQEEALNTKRKHRLLSKQWRDILARNNLAIGGGWRDEMKTILEAQAEQQLEIETRD